jgi:hypothetical protein
MGIFLHGWRENFNSVPLNGARLNANPNIQTTFFFALSIKTLLLKQTTSQMTSTGAQKRQKKTYQLLKIY